MIKSADDRCLLIAGGELDPNLTRLIEIAKSKQIPVWEIRHGQEESPPFSWYLSEGKPRIEDRVVSATGAFIRYDVFGHLSAPKSGASQRGSGWYQTFYGWLLSQPQMRLFNRHHLPMVGNKLAMLILAQKLGLLIPDTWITNEAEKLDKYSVGSTIAKPVAGGDFCYPLEQLHSSIQFRNGCAAMPAIVQNRLVAPEIRIYMVGNHAFAFEICSQHLDYRVQPDAEVISVPTLPDEVELLRKLMANLRIDFGAADFKTDRSKNEATGIFRT